MKLYSVYDQKAESWGQPVFYRAHGEALRGLEDECRRPESIIAAHPEDFVMFYLGDFDETTGTLVVENSPLVLSRASELLPSAAGGDC